MKITQAHLNFYREKKNPRPDWAKDLKHPNSASIHELINSQIEEKRKSTEPHNIIQLIKGAIRIQNRPFFRPDHNWPYENLQQYLYHLAFQPYSTDPKRRTAYARKWYNKLYTLKGKN